MKYNIYGPFEIPLGRGEFKRRIDKEDIEEFWNGVDPGINNACGIYVFSIKTNKKEKPWYVGKAQKQSFEKECFTPHKLLNYHESLEKSKGTPMMYFVARVTGKGRFSKPTLSNQGHKHIDFVERSFLEMAYFKNNNIRNNKGTQRPDKLVVEGFYNNNDRRKKSVKQLYELLVG